jgi:6-pyruvoyl-tetrahydropterin synthase
VKLLLHMNMPSGSNDGTHQVIFSIPGIDDLGRLAALIREKEGVLHGHHYIFDRINGERIWRNRGEMVINFAHVGKIDVYYEGKNETR